MTHWKVFADSYLIPNYLSDSRSQSCQDHKHKQNEKRNYVERFAALDSDGKLVMKSILETKAATILQFIQGLRGSLQVTFEEGTWAAWLYESLLLPWSCVW